MGPWRFFLAMSLFLAAAPVSAGFCDPLPPPTGPMVNATTADVGNLTWLVADLEPGETLLLADGTYDLNGTYLWISTPNVTIRSASGNREAVILDGGYSTTEVISVAASGVTVADLTIYRAGTHAVHVVSTDAGDTLDTLLYNLHVVDPAQQGIKINPHTARVYYPDQGEVACCHIELTDAGRPWIWDINGSCYTGGIDGHRARDWVVRDCWIEGFWCDLDIAEHGVHFWSGSRDTLVERCVIRDCARGIGFGLQQTGDWRTYPDEPCPGVTSADHYGGIVRNNFIWAGRQDLFDSEAGFDGGVALAQACSARVIHNTVFSRQAPFASIEWRFDRTTVGLINNLVSHNLMPRDDAVALLDGNATDAPAGWFVDASVGELHLAAAASGAIDQGAPVELGLCDQDIDGQSRAGLRDVGADELGGAPTPGPTVTPTPAPDLLALTLWMPATEFREGDRCRLDLSVGNPGGSRMVELYVLLAAAGEYFAYPSWAPVTSFLDHESRSFGSGSEQTLAILPEFVMPPVSPFGPLGFVAACFEPGVPTTATLASNVPLREFWLR